MWSKISAMLQNIRKHFEEIFLSMMRKLPQTKMASKFNNCFANVAINLLKDIGESNNKYRRVK